MSTHCHLRLMHLATFQPCWQEYTMSVLYSDCIWSSLHYYTELNRYHIFKCHLKSFMTLMKMCQKFAVPAGGLVLLGTMTRRHMYRCIPRFGFYTWRYMFSQSFLKTWYYPWNSNQWADQNVFHNKDTVISTIVLNGVEIHWLNKRKLW